MPASQANYIERLKLQNPPFTGESNSLYAFEEFNQRLALLHHTGEFADRIILIAGPGGSGKTALLHHLLRKRPEHWQPCLFNADRQLSFDLLLEGLSDALADQAPLNDEHGLNEGVIQQLQVAHLNKQLPILAIDEAEQLPASTLIALLNFLDNLADSQHILRVLLFGSNDSNSQLLESIRDDQRFLHMEPPRLHKNEVESLLMHRLKQAGYRGGALFSPKQIETLAEQSNGFPGSLLQLADQLLSGQEAPPPEKTQDSRPKSLPTLSKKQWLSIGGGLCALVLISTLLWFQEDINQALEPEASTETADPQAPQETVTAAAPEETEEANAPPIIEMPVPPPLPEPELTTDEEPVSDTAEPALVENEQQQDAVPEQLPPEEQLPTNPPEEAPAPLPIEPSPPIETAQPSPPAEPLTAETAEATTPGIKREDWLLSQDKTHWTLQILASRDEKAVRRYIEKNQLQANAAYFLTLRKEQPWYAVVIGSYESRTAANQAAGTLAEQLNTKPWPRSFNAVHKDIHRP